MSNIIRISSAAAILAVGLVLSSVVLSKFFVRIRHEKEQAISVKGYAQQDVVADVGRFDCTCRVRALTLKEAQAELQRSTEVVRAYLEKAGFEDDEIATATIDTTRVYKKNDKGNKTNEIEFYDASQSVSVASGNVALVRDVARSITELIREGIEIQASAPRFYVSDLKSTKHALLERATEDGYHRAVALAENSRGKVGALLSARQGVFQITEPNSTRVSSSGVYDTSTIEKTVKAVVTLEYAIEAGR